jgi:cell division protein FtsL
MTVASLVHSNIVNSRRSSYKTGTCQSKRAKRFLTYILIFAVLSCGFLYVFVTNNIAAKGYEIRSLTKQMNELNSVNKNLQVEVSNLKSINALGAKSSDLEMVKAQKVEYVSLPKSSALLVQ